MLIFHKINLILILIKNNHDKTLNLPTSNNVYISEFLV